MKSNFAVIVPMANESKCFYSFIKELQAVLNDLESGTVYLIVDNASKDDTLDLCLSISEKDSSFVTVWAPENKNVVDAYLRGYREALKNQHEIVIEMDAGLSHDPRAIPMFLRVLNEGNECAFGSRFINGGSIVDSSWKRTVLSRLGTYLSNWLLGTNLNDATSGFQGFHARIVSQFVSYDLHSKGHFYQTELRYLLRNSRFMEIPIHYRAPSPSVSAFSIKNSIEVLFHYAALRIKGKSPLIL